MSDDGRMVDGSKWITKNSESSSESGSRVFHNIPHRKRASKEPHHFNHSSDIGSSHFYPSDMMSDVISLATQGEKERAESSRRRREEERERKERE